MLSYDFSQIAYEVSTDGFNPIVDSTSAQIGGTFFIIVVALGALFVLLAIVIFLFRSTKKKSSGQTDSLVSSSTEDPESDIVSNAFKK